MRENQRTVLPIYRAVIAGSTDLTPAYARLIRRKHRAYLNQSQKFSEMQQDTDIAEWLEDFQLWDQANCELICLNENQRRDLNLVLQKQYALLQWEQGSGKRWLELQSDDIECSGSICIALGSYHQRSRFATTGTAYLPTTTCRMYL